MDWSNVSFFQFVWEVTVIYNSTKKRQHFFRAVLKFCSTNRLFKLFITSFMQLVKYGQITSFASRIIVVGILPLLALLLYKACILFIVLNRSILLNSNCL